MATSIFNHSHAFLVIGDIDTNAVKAELKIAPGDDQILTGDEIKIEDLRALIRWINLKPMTGGAKLIVIANADKITAEAANTLLKTLEEPPAYAKIILTTLDEQKILATIQSRCQKIRFLVNPKEQAIEGYLAPDELGPMSIKEKFAWVAKIAELPTATITDILTAWQMHFRGQMLRGIDKIGILKQIGRAKDLLQTNISVKLLLENLILQM